MTDKQLNKRTDELFLKENPDLDKKDMPYFRESMLYMQTRLRVEGHYLIEELKKEVRQVISDIKKSTI